MSRKSKKDQHSDATPMDKECFDCLEALIKCVFESNHAARAMLKEKAVASCNSCTHFHTIKKK